MTINFVVNDFVKLVNGQPVFGWEPTDKRLGGTEESVREWAEELVKRGHSVKVYRNSRIDDHSDMLIRGVNYVGTPYYKGGGDICINVKSSHIAPKEPTLYLTNETDADKADLSAYLGVILPSQWAVDNITVNNKTFILPHGYDPKQIYSGEKVPKQCLYASSPDRGLDTLLRAWPSVMRAHPDATLIVTYDAQEYDVEGVKFVEATEEEMNELYRTSDIWVHPCSGGELYGMTGVKAQAAGCWPVYFPTMALAETVKYGTKSTPETFTQDLINALNGHPKPPKLKYPNWETSTDELLNIISEVLK